MKNKNDLERDGFEEIASWMIRNGKIKPSSLNWEDSAGSIYAFVTGTDVRYVGMATTVLRTRLDGYSYQLNDRVGNLIAMSIGRDEPVIILRKVFPSVSRVELEAIESGYISSCECDWNVRK